MLCRLAAMSVTTGVCQGVHHGLGEILPPALQASLKVGPLALRPWLPELHREMHEGPHEPALLLGS